jgi:transcriptional regulator with XRE-family HTH domain
VDDDFFEKLAGAVLELRGDRSQRVFAKILDVSQGAIQSWESKQSLPDLGNLQKLATLRGEKVEVFIAYLCGRPFGETVPAEQQVKGMSGERLARLQIAIGEEMMERSQRTKKT